MGRTIERWINLDPLKDSDGIIHWKDISNVLVDFGYDGTVDKLTIVRYIDQYNVLIRYRDKEIPIQKSSLRIASLGKIFDFYVSGNYKYNIGDCIDTITSKIQVIDQIRVKKKKSSVKGYRLICLKCNREFEAQETNVLRGDGCPICSKHKIIAGVNDLWTTAPWIAKCLKNPEDGYYYSCQSNKAVNFICPECGQDVGLKKISDIYYNHSVGCRNCGRGTSYPNRFMSNVLDTLKINYIPEKTFDWCKFVSYDGTYTYTGIYDFFLPNEHLLIEMDSDLGHGKIIYKGSKKTPEETVYIDKQKDQLARENGYEVIRVNCSYLENSNNPFWACKNGVINTLSHIFDLSGIDWDLIEEKSLAKRIKAICEEYNKGKSCLEISQKFKLDFSTVNDYLHKGTKIGLCNFVPYKQTSRPQHNDKPIICLSANLVFKDTDTLCLYAPEILGVEIDKDEFYANYLKGYKGLQWKRISKIQFNQLLIDRPDICYGSEYDKEIMKKNYAYLYD